MKTKQEEYLDRYRKEVYETYAWKKFTYIGQPAYVDVELRPQGKEDFSDARVLITIAYMDNSGIIHKESGSMLIDPTIDFLKSITNED